MNLKKNPHKTKTSPDYELEIRTANSNKKGAPNFILRRKLRDAHQDNAMNNDTQSTGNSMGNPVQTNGSPISAGATSQDVTASILSSVVKAVNGNEEASSSEEHGEANVSANQVADYILSLQNHVPDDINRVVDAIIQEESALPSNLPHLDDKLSAIFPGSDVLDVAGEEMLYEREEKAPVHLDTEKKAVSYRKKVEY